MKTLLLSIAMALMVTLGASAQIFKVGLRGGVNIANNDFEQVSTGDYQIGHIKSKPGYQVALVTRITLPRFVQISPEFQMVAHNYRYRLSGPYSSREVSVAVKRFEIPLIIGVNISALRIFGGPVFRVAQITKVKNGRSGFGVDYDDADVALVAGAGLDLGKFFIDARYNFYPKEIQNRIKVDGVTRTAKIKNNGMWQFSAGFFF